MGARPWRAGAGAPSGRGIRERRIEAVLATDVPVEPVVLERDSGRLGDDRGVAGHDGERMVAEGDVRAALSGQRRDLRLRDAPNREAPLLAVLLVLDWDGLHAQDLGDERSQRRQVAAALPGE